MLSLYFDTDRMDETYDDVTTLREGDFYCLVFPFFFMTNIYICCKFKKEMLKNYDDFMSCEHMLEL